MNIFFSHKRTYVTHEPLEDFNVKLKSIVDRRWYDFSENITGNVHADGNFTLTHKWSFTYIIWFETSPAYLSGTISPDIRGTIITSTVRPNSMFVILFYLLSALFLFELLGSNTFVKGPKLFKLIFIPFFNLILFGIIKFYTTGLRNRFEKILNLRSAK